MTRKLLAVSMVALAGWRPPQARADQNRIARGTVTSIDGDTFSARVMGREMRFVVDGRTHVEAVGGTTKTLAARSAGRLGPQIGELLRAGQSVEVSYRDAGGALQATRIRAIARVSDGADDDQSQGVVKSISPTSMTIAGSVGEGTFTQTFAIDAKTKVIAKGAGTATASTRGRAAITTLVAPGDSVKVSYRKEIADSSLHASEVRVVKR